MNRILIVEDDADLAVIVTDSLTAQQFVVEHADSASAARDKLRSGRFDAIVMDWDLHGESGVDVVREYRAGGGKTPVVMLTGRTSIHEKEAGLDAGADDYLTKPFLMRELSARIKALLRRASVYTPEPASPLEATPGAVIASRYQLEEVIGEGGMAVVWRAMHTGLNKPVVVKFLLPHLAASEAATKRFEHECRAMSRISHPNVVEVYDVGYLASGRPYLVMEYVPGESLRSLIEAGGPMPEYLTLEIALQLCQGLAETHAQGIVHRDLKPDNVIIHDRTDRPDWVKIVDFGIAHLQDTQERLTQEGLIVGTVEYVAPEQLSDAPIDGRADIYALGIIMFEMLTGRLPFEGKTPNALLVKKLMEAPQLPSAIRSDILPDSLINTIVKRALEREPLHRYQDVEELRRDLDYALSLL